MTPEQITLLLSSYDDGVISLSAEYYDNHTVLGISIARSSRKSNDVDLKNTIGKRSEIGCSLDNLNRELFSSIYMMILASDVKAIHFDFVILDYLSPTCFDELVFFSALFHKRNNGKVSISNLAESIRESYLRLGYIDIIEYLQRQDRSPEKDLQRGITTPDSLFGRLDNVSLDRIASWHDEYQASLDRYRSPWNQPVRGMVEEVLRTYHQQVNREIKNRAHGIT